MLPLGLFRNRGVHAARRSRPSRSPASFFAIFLYTTLYLQQVLGLSAIEAGLVYLPGTVLIFVVSGASASSARRSRAGSMIAAGLALVAIGMLAVHAGRHATRRGRSSCPAMMVALLRHRPVQPGGQRGRARLGAAGAERPRRRRQRHVPPGRHRGRRRRPRRADPGGAPGSAAARRRRSSTACTTRCSRARAWPRRPPSRRSSSSARTTSTTRSWSCPWGRSRWPRRPSLPSQRGSRRGARPGAAAGGSRPPASRRGAAASARVRTPSGLVDGLQAERARRARTPRRRR